VWSDDEQRSTSTARGQLVHSQTPVPPWMTVTMTPTSASTPPVCARSPLVMGSRLVTQTSRAWHVQGLQQWHHFTRGSAWMVFGWRQMCLLMRTHRWVHSPVAWRGEAGSQLPQCWKGLEWLDNLHLVLSHLWRYRANGLVCGKCDTTCVDFSSYCKGSSSPPPTPPGIRTSVRYIKEKEQCVDLAGRYALPYDESMKPRRMRPKRRGRPSGLWASYCTTTRARRKRGTSPAGTGQITYHSLNLTNHDRYRVSNCQCFFIFQRNRLFAVMTSCSMHPVASSRSSAGVTSVARRHHTSHTDDRPKNSRIDA
jgi:hypothetical protein